MARQVIVEIVGDDKKLSGTLDNAQSKMGKFGSVAKGVGVGIGLGVWGLAADAVGGFINQLGEAGQAYRDDQVSQQKLKNTLENTVKGFNGSTQAIEDYASAQQVLGFQDDEIRDSIGQLVGITHDQTKAMELNTLAQDLARAKGLDLAVATDIVTKAAQGNGKALKGLGIDVSGATTAAEFLDAAQKNVEGSAAAWAETSEGKQAAAQAKQAEAWEKIGSVVDRVSSVVMPIMAEAMTVIADVVLNVVDAVEPLVTQLVKELTPAFNTVVSFITKEVIPVLTRVMNAVIPPLKVAIGILGDVFRTVFGFIATYVGTEIAIVKKAIDIAITVFNAVSTTIQGVAKTVGESVGKVVGFFTGIGDKIDRATRGMWDGIWAAFKSVINSIIRGWNSLKFTMPSVDLGPLGHVGGFTIGTPNIPYLHRGGIVPGLPGSDVPTILQAGEQVIRRDKAGGGDVHIHIGTFVGSGPDIDRLADLIAQRMRLQGA